MLTSGDKQVVYNLRQQLGDELAKYSDEAIAEAWRNFSMSEDYPDIDKFLLWLE